MKLGKIEQENGSMKVENSDPGEGGKQVVVPTRERMGERLQSELLVLKSEEREE